MVVWVGVLVEAHSATAAGHCARPLVVDRLAPLVHCASSYYNEAKETD